MYHGYRWLYIPIKQTYFENVIFYDSLFPFSEVSSTSPLEAGDFLVPPNIILNIRYPSPSARNVANIGSDGILGPTSSPVLSGASLIDFFDALSNHKNNQLLSSNVSHIAPLRSQPPSLPSSKSDSNEDAPRHMFPLSDFSTQCRSIDTRSPLPQALVVSSRPTKLTCFIQVNKDPNWHAMWL